MKQEEEILIKSSVALAKIEEMCKEAKLMPEVKKAYMTEASKVHAAINMMYVEQNKEEMSLGYGYLLDIANKVEASVA